MWHRAKTIWLWISPLVVIVSAWGGFRSGVDTMTADVQRLNAALAAKTDYQLEYRNIGHKASFDAARNQQFIQIVALLHNPTAQSIFVQRVESKSSLEGRRSNPTSGANDVVEVFPGLDMPVFDAPIYAQVVPNGYAEGRADFTYAYGLTRENLSKRLHIKGGIAIDDRGTTGNFMWYPDEGSTKPIGMSVANVLGTNGDPLNPGTGAAIDKLP